MQKRTKHVLVVLVLVALLALAVFLFFRSLKGPVPVAEFDPPVILPEIQSLDDLERFTANKPLPEQSPVADLALLDPYDHVYGESEASTIVFLYTNVRNPYARLMTDSLKALADEDPAIAFVYRHYPYQDPPEDLQASELSECMFLEQGDSAFWSFLSQVQGKEFDLDGMLVSVVDIGGDPDAARTCLGNRETWNYVLSQRQQAELVSDITVSPSVVIWHRPTNDVRIIPGANPMSYIQRTLDEMRS